MFCIVIYLLYSILKRAKFTRFSDECVERCCLYFFVDKIITTIQIQFVLRTKQIFPNRDKIVGLTEAPLSSARGSHKRMYLE